MRTFFFSNWFFLSFENIYLPENIWIATVQDLTDVFEDSSGVFTDFYLYFIVRLSFASLILVCIVLTLLAIKSESFEYMKFISPSHQNGVGEM